LGGATVENASLWLPHCLAAFPIGKPEAGTYDCRDGRFSLFIRKARIRDLPEETVGTEARTLDQRPQSKVVLIAAGRSKKHPGGRPAVLKSSKYWSDHECQNGEGGIQVLGLGKHG